MKSRDAVPYIAIAGPGAIGGVLAVSFRRAGESVALLGRGSPPDSLKVLDPQGRRWRANGWLANPCGRCKAVFLTVKSPGIAAAIGWAKKVARPDTPIVSLLNGVTHWDPILRAFGPTRAVFGACYIAAMRKNEDTVLHTGGEGLLLGRTPENRAAALTAGALLKKAGWNAAFTPFPQRLLWTKMVYNSAVNSIGALTRKTNGQLATEPALRELVTQVVTEASGIANAAGFPPLDSRPADRVLRGCLSAPDQINSMAQDIAAGRPTEADSILLPLIRAAKRAGIETRYLGSLYRMIRELEGRTR